MSLYVNLISTFDDKGLKQADGAVGVTESKLGKFGKAAGAAFAAAGVAAAGFAATVAVDAVNAASDFAETISKSNVIFGDAASIVQEFAETSGASLGQTKQQALDAASSFAVFGKSAGLAGTDLAKFSLDFTVLASDLASFNNTTPEEAIQAIGAALRGESEPLRRYGVLLDDATMRQKALELGLIKTTKEALTPQNKVLAAQALIFEQTKDAQGDFARTSDGLANSQRILTAEIENFKIGLGEKLLPIVLQLVTFLKDNFVPVLQNLGSAGGAVTPIFEKMAGYFEQNVLPVLKDFGQFIMGTIVPALKNTFTPVLEGVQFAFATIMQAIEDNRPALMSLYEAFKTVVGWIATNVLPIVGGALGAAFKGAAVSISTVINFISNLIEGFKSFVNFTKSSVAVIKSIFTAIGNAITYPFKWAFKQIAEYWNKTLGNFKIKIPDWVPLIGGKEFAFPKLPVPQLAEGGIVKARKGGTLALIGEGGRDEAVIPLPRGRKPGDFIGTPRNPIVINVNGALDPEAVARQIETILKRSRLRAGNYA